MRGVDEGIGSVFRQVGDEARRATETADADGHGLCDRRVRSPGQRQRHGKAFALGEAARQMPRLGGPAENEDVSHGAA